ncbi:hypothetical protein JQN58_09080 [Aneurinibacillus sp. BA2021]|nr:hypothetical protein [Aneurinibacillus sp. BA2021]
MKNKILTLVVTALIFISINGMIAPKEVEKESVNSAQQPTSTVLRLPYQH